MEPFRLPAYASENGVVDNPGLVDAVRQWQNGEADTETLMSTLDAWGDGTPVDGCP